jgi:hypothetical protein
MYNYLIVIFDYLKKPPQNPMVFRPTDFAAGDYFFQSRLPEKTTGSRGGAVYSYSHKRSY